MSTAPLRQELEDLIRRDLLGPAGGEKEIITEQSVRNRYLLGMLAPLKAIEPEEEPFEELADGTEDNAEEGTAEPSTPAKRRVAPSTFGLSFCLDLAETAFRGEAHWGQYLREQDADGKTVWKRYPRGSSKTIPLRKAIRPHGPRTRECPQVRSRADSAPRGPLERHAFPFQRTRRRPPEGHVLAVSGGIGSTRAICKPSREKGMSPHWIRSRGWRIGPTRCSTAANWNSRGAMASVLSGIGGGALGSSHRGMDRPRCRAP